MSCTVCRSLCRKPYVERMNNDQSSPMSEICCFFFCVLPGAQLSEYNRLCHVERTTEVVLIYCACCVISISDRGFTRGAVAHVGSVERQSDSGVRFRRHRQRRTLICNFISLIHLGEFSFYLQKTLYNSGIHILLFQSNP